MNFKFNRFVAILPNYLKSIIVKQSNINSGKNDLIKEISIM